MKNAYASSCGLLEGSHASVASNAACRPPAADAQQYRTAAAAAAAAAPALSASPPSQVPLSLVVVGGGAGGIEVCLSLAYRLGEERRRLGLPDAAKAKLS
eukprot:103252-Chlamydomonas_euryale.AAC.1